MANLPNYRAALAAALAANGAHGARYYYTNPLPATTWQANPRCGGALLLAKALSHLSSANGFTLAALRAGLRAAYGPRVNAHHYARWLARAGHIAAVANPTPAALAAAVYAASVTCGPKYCLQQGLPPRFSSPTCNAAVALCIALNTVCPAGFTLRAVQHGLAVQYGVPLCQLNYFVQWLARCAILVPVVGGK